MRRAAEPAIALLCLCAATLSGTCAESDGKTRGDGFGRSFIVSAEALEAAGVRGFRESPGPGHSSTPDPADVLTTAPYRSIGALVGSSGGVGGAASPPASPRWLFFHADHLSSPRVVTDSSGNVVSTHHYMPFGDEKPLPVRVSSDNNRFTGHERDVESALTENPDGLDYMLARYYSASLGRFMSPDPLAGYTELPQTLNRYTYTGNNPLRFVDPDGRDFYLNCTGNSDTCQGGHAGTTYTDENGNSTFEPTTVANDDQGNLVDMDGNQYTADFDGTNLELTNESTGQETDGSWVPGSADTQFTQEGGNFDGTTFNFTQTAHEQTFNGTFVFGGGTNAAFERRLTNAGFVYWIGFHRGTEYRTPGDPDRANSSHFTVSPQAQVPVGPPASTGDFHTGEVYPGHDPITHFFRDVL